ncbi:MAG: FixH family protein [Sediminibacterium sp.]
MNWGYRIVVAFGLGVAFILFLVWKTMRVDIEMVESNYYEKEMAFNGKLQATANANALSTKVSVVKQDQQILLKIDSTTAAAITTAEVHFYNPASEKSDRKLNIAASNNGVYVFPVAQFNKGKYIAKISFTSAGKNYYAEEVIFIP